MEQGTNGLIIECQNSLYKRALGKCVVRKKKTKYFFDPQGNRIKDSEEIIEETLPPDTGALVFSLTNLAPDKWRNRQNELSNVDIKQTLTDSLEIFKKIQEVAKGDK